MGLLQSPFPHFRNHIADDMIDLLKQFKWLEKAAESKDPL